MDAVLYLKEYRRIGNTYCDWDGGGCDCNICPFEKDNDCILYHIDDVSPERMVAIVEKWSREHPAKTNRQKFYEVFGETSVNDLFESEQIEGTALFGIKHTAWWEQEYIEPKEKKE